jgi:predicted DCC family thiol-disulfide oxidoreductase YuxK
MDPSLPPDALLVLYDGVCGFCNAMVRFLLPRDRQQRLWFAPLEGPLAAEVLARHGHTPAAGDTFYVVTGLGRPSERVVSRSTAALTVGSALGWPWRLVSWLRFIPRPLRDAGYSLVARWRYRIFGKLEACPRPRPEWRARFLD